MADINRVILVGRLTRDSELKYTSGGSPVAKFGLAVNRRRKVGEQWEEEANFFDIVVWGRVAEALSQYLVKGKQVGIEGELRQDRWEQDGQKRSRVEVVASNIMLLGGRGEGGPSGGGGGGGGGGGSGGQPRSGGPSAPGPGGQTGSEGQDDFEDDIPF
jgi:single-strand DNA-binding protein